MPVRFSSGWVGGFRRGVEELVGVAVGLVAQSGWLELRVCVITG